MLRPERCGCSSALHIARRTLREADFRCRMKDSIVRMATRMRCKTWQFRDYPPRNSSRALSPRASAIQLLEQLFGFFQIGQLKAFGEPIVDFG